MLTLFKGHKIQSKFSGSSFYLAGFKFKNYFWDLNLWIKLDFVPSKATRITNVEKLDETFRFNLFAGKAAKLSLKYMGMNIVNHAHK